MIDTSIPVKRISYNGNDFELVGGANADNVRFIDYDGTIFKSFSREDFLELTEMPENPTHAGLVAQGWNWSLANAQDYVNDYGILDIGQMYTTDDGATRLYVDLTEFALGVGITFVVNGTANINWGDETTDTLTSSGSAVSKTHTYASAGSYVISIIVPEGSTAYCSYKTGFNQASIFWGGGSSYSAYKFGTYADCLKKMEIGERFTQIQGLTNYINLQYLTIPNTVTNIGYGSSYLGIMNIGIKSLTIPNSVTDLSGSKQLSFSGDYLSIPNSITGLAGSFSGIKLRLCVPKNVVFNSAVTVGEFAGKNSNNSCYALKIYKKAGELGAYGLTNNYSTFYVKGVKADNVNITTDIDDYAYKYSDLKNVTIGGEATSIGQYAFDHSLAKTINLGENINSLGVYSFGYSQVEKLVFPKKVRTIPNNCAYYSYDLEEIELKGAKTIGTNSFAYCTRLSKITFNEGLETIGANAFQRDSSIPYNRYPVHLDSLIIPSTVTTIGNTAFSLANSTLKELKFTGLTPPQFVSKDFNDSSTKVYVPQGTLSAYQSATNAPSGTYVEYAYDTYSVTTTITNGTATGGSTITSMGGLELTLTADSGYVLPESITVTNAEYNYYPDTGELILFNATDDVTVSITCESE